MREVNALARTDVYGEVLGFRLREAALIGRQRVAARFYIDELEVAVFVTIFHGTDVGFYIGQRHAGC